MYFFMSDIWTPFCDIKQIGERLFRRDKETLPMNLQNRFRPWKRECEYEIT